MKQILLVCCGLFAAGVAGAAQVVMNAEPETSPYLLVLAGLALICTIAHRRNKLKARS